MNRRLAIVVLFTLCFQPAAAASPAMDFSYHMPSMEQFYTDFDGTLRCLDCAFIYLDCACALSQSSSSYPSPPSNESSLYDPPVINAHSDAVDLTEVPNFVTDSSRLLMDSTFQYINEDATTVQPVTVQAHIEDTYLPGCRQPTSPAESQCGPQRRQAPRKNGFACNAEGCNKAFDRNCELNRHLKVHLGRSERPHRCTCGEGFLYPKDLIRHQRKHVEQAAAKVTYYCHVPGCTNTEGFSRRDNLLRHHRRQHEGVASPPA
ncbi:uncharacterized protein M421DRAFT_426172 [Didymella exigua CBS 183.55]|uniref:C2H2-type domain-containing protein n=1 Tax=Didymella exigua CBS 183.55 TaxID=1150837 RepID=A0A6A5R4P4_9PLEO|nr:uncharacterized protein M421DRAFT_426172 [Didymella exigua CBS 183.55]KAF1923071.1 hypothetical protein M421DRAFT_426172 [Didymella exigua CBS 183.55]